MWTTILLSIVNMDHGCDSDMSDYPEPRSETELRTALRDVFLAAHTNGVHVSESRWVIATDETDVQDWEVEVVPLTESATD